MQFNTNQNVGESVSFCISFILVEYNKNVLNI